MNFKKLLIEASKIDYDKSTAKEIYNKGKKRRTFDFNKGLDALIEKDTTGEWIFNAGVKWKQFDYKKGLDALIKKDKTGGWVYYAGIVWRKFDHKKAMNILKEISPNKYYLKAKADWPLTGKETLDMIDDKLKKTPHRKDRTLKLEDTEIDYYKLQPNTIYNKGVLRPEAFDFKKGLNSLIKKDKKGEYILFAGKDWKEFDFEKGFDALFNIDKTGEWIYKAGLYWVYWKQFDYEKVSTRLKEISPNKYYLKAKKNWPLTGKEALDKTADELKKAPHRKDRTLKL